MLVVGCIGEVSFQTWHEKFGFFGLDYFTAYMYGNEYHYRSWLALSQNNDFIVISGNTTLNYRCGFGKCMAVMDVNNYRLGMRVVVDCYKVQNVWMKET